MTVHEEKFYTIQQVADRLQVSRKSVYEWMNAGRLRWLQVGKRRRITESALIEMVTPKREEVSPKNT